MSTNPAQFTPEAAENFVRAFKEAQAQGSFTKKDMVAAMVQTLGMGGAMKVPDSVRDYISQCVGFVFDELAKDPDADVKQVAQNLTSNVAPMPQQSFQEAMAEVTRTVARALANSAQDFRASSSVDQQGFVDSQNQLIENFIAKSNLEGQVKDDVRRALQEVSTAKPEDADLLVSRISPSLFGGVDNALAGQEVGQSAQPAKQAPATETAAKNEASQKCPQPAATIDQSTQPDAPGAKAAKPRKLTKPKPSMEVLAAMRRNLQGNCPDAVGKVITAELSGWLSSKRSTAKQIADFNEGFDLAMKNVSEAIVPLEHEQALQSMRALKSVLEDPATCTAQKSIQTKGFLPEFSAIEKFCKHLASHPQCTKDLRQDAIDIMSGWANFKTTIKKRERKAKVS